MNSLKTLIVDDEPLAHEIILDYAKELPFIKIIGQCYLATEALGFLREQPVDLLLLDINMPKLKGLDLLKVLRDPPIVVVTTAYESYAIESFELDVCDYLLKPFRLDRFLKAMNKAYEWYQLKQESPKPLIAPSLNQPESFLFIKSDKKWQKIQLADIQYLEAYGNYVKVWTHSNQPTVTPRTLSSFDEELPSSDFMKIHKSYIINRGRIDFVQGNEIQLSNGPRLPIGKNYRKMVQNFLKLDAL